MKTTDLIGKKLVAFGDSVTAEATIGCPKTYINLFCEKYQIGSFKNYAIGGTTATYMFKGSNIEKEYTQPDKLFAVDGCRVVNEAVDKGETKDASIAFIAYSHNDMFFQVPIDNKQVVDDSLSLKNCNSFKASYRYMINKLRSNNPNIIIILINSTYSEYDKNAELIYGNKYSYSDYRTAIKEISEELNCICIEPWDYMKPYFDYGNKLFYYKDFIHPSVEGQKILFDFIDKEVEQKLF